MTKKSLGKGLGALLGDTPAESSAPVAFLPITRIEPAENQPRKAFDEEALSELSESIRLHGVLQPIAVRKLGEELYQIIAGERRWRAARLAGLSEIPVVILDADDRTVMELALVENLQREDLNPIEQAEGFRRLIDEFGLTQEELSSRLGVSRPALANSLRLLSLPDTVRALVESGTLSAGHGRALLQINDTIKMEAAARRVAEEHLSVRQTELLAARLAAEKVEAPPAEQPVNYLEALEEDLSGSLGRRVRIVKGKRKGRFEIEFYNNDDFEAFLSILKGI